MSLPSPQSRKREPAWCLSFNFNEDIARRKCTYRLEAALIDRGYECLRVQDVLWSGKKNGELLALADANFDVLITLDSNLEYQQNLTGRRLALLVIKLKSQTLNELLEYVSDYDRTLKSIRPGEIARVGMSEDQ